MDLTVIVCTFNRAHLLEQALAHLLRQQTAPTILWEILVVDNNSRDSTRAVVEGLSGRTQVPVRYAFRSDCPRTRAPIAGLAGQLWLPHDGLARYPSPKMYKSEYAHTTSCGAASNTWLMRSSFCCSHISSASITAPHSPDASSIPRFRAIDSPRFS
jgi:glycosyltransferase involved in cell wall biosynthesis